MRADVTGGAPDTAVPEDGCCRTALTITRVGLDVGSVNARLTIVCQYPDGYTRRLAEQGCAAAHGDEYTLAEVAGHLILASPVRRLTGAPLEASRALLEDARQRFPFATDADVRVTGAGAGVVARALGADVADEFRATARAAATLLPGVQSVFEIGGSSSRFLRLDGGNGHAAAAIVDYEESGDCAAGTGTFLDQQAQRLRFAPEDVGTLALEAARAPRIAGRCSVFAKSDMIHAQQKGFSPEEILRGLCEAVARNYKSGIIKGRDVAGPVVLLGGVAQNAGVVEALRQVCALTNGDLAVPALGPWFGAIGAALLPPDRLSLVARTGSCDGERDPVEGNWAEVAGPLDTTHVQILRDRGRVPAAVGGCPEVTLGFDIGSVSTKLVALDRHGAVLHESYLRTDARPVEAAGRAMEEMRQHLGEVSVLAVGTTGSGRELIAELVGADVVHDEITAHKTGALHVGRELGLPAPDTILEIGGQDSKFIAIDRGVVVDFAMNEACAAGTGSFLEEQASRLGVIIQEFAGLALSAQTPARLGERCTVFMETDVTNWLLRGEQVPNLLAGLARSVAMNYLNRVVRGRRIGEAVYFQGGTAYNDAVAAAFAGLLGRRVIVPPHNGVIGAIGVAAIAAEWKAATGRASRFRAGDPREMVVPTRDFTCHGCTNTCDVREVTVDGRKTYWGDRCSDRYRKPVRTEREPVVPDLMAFRDEALDDATKTDATTASSRLRIGLPRTLAVFDKWVFWHTYVTNIGAEVVASPPTSASLARAGIEATVAAPCFPVQVAHGHVLALLDAGLERILLPNVLDAELPADVPGRAHLCPWNQTIPWVVALSPQVEQHRDRLLTPTLHFQAGATQVKRSLAAMAETLGIRRRVSDAAVDAAYAAQAAFDARLLQAGTEALDALRRAGQPGLLLLGRPYNIYDRNVTCDVPRKLRKLYGVNVIPVDFVATGREPLDLADANMFWASGRRMLAAANVARERGDLHVIHITNFKCGPDSFLKSFIREAAGSPLLVLQFDGHGHDAGYMTRCEAFLDSKGMLRCYAHAN